MASFGHCQRCGGHHGMCSDHSGCFVCQCPPRGWQCPVCGAGLAPSTSRCPCVDEPKGCQRWVGPNVVLPNVTITPVGEIVSLQ